MRPIPLRLIPLQPVALRPVALRPVALLGLAILAVTSAACGSTQSSDDTATPSTPTSEPVATTAPPTTVPSTTATTTPPTTAPRDDEAAILAAVDGYFVSFITINNPPDPDHPDLERYRTGPALEATLESTQRRVTFGQALRLADDSLYGHTSEVVERSDQEATVRSCMVDDSILFDWHSDTVLRQEVGTNEVSVRLLHVDGGWRVSEIHSVEKWEGNQKCPGFE